MGGTIRYYYDRIGTVIERKTKKGGETFSIDYQIKGKRFRPAVREARTLADALKVLLAKITDASSREYGFKRKTPELTFMEMSELYLEKHAKVYKKGWRRADAVYLKPLCASFGPLKLCDVTPEKVGDYRARRLADGLKGSSINRELACLRKVFNVAIDRGCYAGVNPVKKGMMFSEKENRRKRVLSPAEESKLLEACPAYLRSRVFLACHSGMRRGEVLALKCENVDLDVPEIHVVHSKGRPRVIPVNSELLSELRTLRAAATADEYVFTNPKTGRPYADIQRAWRKACAEVGIVGLWVHDLRRTFASRLAKPGINTFTLQNLMGHASVATTQRYIVVEADEKRKAVETLCKKPPQSENLCQTAVKRESGEAVAVPPNDSVLIS